MKPWDATAHVPAQFLYDSGWISITPLNGWKQTTYTCQIRRIGPIVYIRGRLDGTAATKTTFASLPPEMRPSVLFGLSIYTNNGTTYFNVYPNGNLTTKVGASNTNFGPSWVAT